MTDDTPMDPPASGGDGDDDGDVHEAPTVNGDSPQRPANRWSSAALAAEDQRRMQELIYQRRLPRPRRSQGTEARLADARRPRSIGGIVVLLLTVHALLAGMWLRGALLDAEDDGPVASGAVAPGTAPAVAAPTVTEPLVVRLARPGAPKVCKLPDERNDQADELYKGTDVNRQLLPYSPFRLIEYPCSNLAGNIRMTLLYRDAIVLLQGGQVTRAIPFDATKEVSFRAVAQRVNDPSWIAEVSAGIFQADTGIVQLAGTSMTIASPDMKELRLTNRQHVFLGGRGANVRIDGVKITSWDPERGGPDLDPSDGRAYILYERGSRLDINRSEITYLGSDRSGAYGTSWRTGGTTGSAIDSTFVHNWFGVYTFEARDIVFRGNTFADNDLYGLDPHDYSFNLTVERNVVHGNGSHGLIFSRGVVNSVMRDNHVYDNGGNGIVLDLGSDHNVIENNLVENNKKDGIVLIGSGNSRISNNTVRGNRTGFRANDPGTRNIDVDHNVFEGNRTGVHIYKGAGNLRFTSNTVVGTAGTAFIAEGQATVRDLVIRDARTGIDARTAVDLQEVRIEGVEVGLLARDRGVLDVRSTTVQASAVGVRLLPGTASATADDVVIDAPDRLKATSDRVNWRHVLPYVGVGAIVVAIVLEVLRGSRTRGERARLAPVGVTNIR